MNQSGYESDPDAQTDLLDLNQVMQAFGVTTWQNLGPVEASLSHSLSLLVDINGDPYILRERPEGLLGADLNHRYLFQQYLQQAGIPIPSYWRTPQGESAVIIGDDAFELQQQVVGELFDSSSPQCLAWVDLAGSMLARIHQASRQYRGPVYRWPSETNIGGLVQGYLNQVRSQADTYPTQAVSAALSNWVDQWEAVLPAAMMSIGTGKGLPELHIHGDYHALNLRFGAFGVSAVTGWEATRWEKRLFEVAYALFYFSALAWQPGSSLTHPLVKRGLEPERARRFLQAYQAVYPPVPGEAALLADALTLVSPIATMNGPLEDVFYIQSGSAEAVIDDLMERLAWASSLPAWLARVRRSLPDMWT